MGAALTRRCVLPREGERARGFPRAAAGLEEVAAEEYPVPVEFLVPLSTPGLKERAEDHR